MAASLLLQALYTSLLSSVGDLSGKAGGSSPDSSSTQAHLSSTVLASTTAGTVRGTVDNSAQPAVFRYLCIPFAKPPTVGDLSGRAGGSSPDSTVLASTTAGTVRGSVDDSAQPAVLRYLGVPFAKPPTGDLRFEPPVPPELWPGVRDAFSVSAQCWQPQFAALANNLTMSEDCLYLNVYTPSRESSAGLLPVMVWIHGGGYFLGSGSTYNGTRLARQGGVVVVTVNYRLGVFGFLSTEDSAMPGNYGLLDQIHALKWVRDNIASFGGDPNSVTVFGQSAGASSVSLLILSPLAKGLFQRAIMESGVALAPWSFSQPTQRLSPVYGARMVGKENGCDHEFGLSDSFIRCLRKINASALIESASHVSEILDDYLWLQPRVENDFGVLPKNPLQILSQVEYNQVDTIRGFNSHENGEARIRNNTLSVNSSELFMELMRNYLQPYAFPGVDDLLQMFKDIYLGNNNDPEFIKQKASEAFSDLWFAGPTLAELKLVTTKSLGTRHYLYRYDYRDSFSTMPSWIGAIHGDELKHVFGLDQLDFPSLGLDKVTETPEDKAMTDRMMNLWSNFARTGDPTASKSPLTWTPFTTARQWMMTINTTSSHPVWLNNITDNFMSYLFVGDLRFQAPMNPKPWAGVKNAFEISPQCWQPYMDAFPNTLPNSEDCLYLNVYTPSRESSAGLLPVMVWIHGGGYFLGSGSTYNGTRLARQGGVVVVTVNYRLGVFGFLSTEDSAMPGNYGLLDQIQALKWVRDNIASFGGDPNSVTVFGESAGSTSVSLLVLSPLAKGLFQRAIMESGVSLAPWGHVHPTQRLSPVYGARMVGKANGCDHEFGLSDSFVRCLKGIDASALIDSASYVSSVIDNIFAMWLLPRVEDTFGVLPDAPLEMLTRGEFNQVDTLRGFNSHENGEIKIRNGTRAVDSKETFIELVNSLFNGYAFPGKDALVNMILDTYIGNNNAPEFIVQKASEASSDISFAGSILAELKLYAAKSPGKNHYLYRFDYRDSFSTTPDWVGAIHGDELKYVFGLDGVEFSWYDGLTQTAEDLAMTDRVISMWSSFAKTGDPTADSSQPKWTPFTNTQQSMMAINTKATVSQFSRPEIVAIYENILQVFYGKGVFSQGVVG
ncbi:hypothetical protein EGW08_008113 [Elysia chlorotica]|uniref:Carboxylesterase type B domain-containing protein n=1 Tax=Elysia chlorotica TaxID=188477 RepID=A0A433TRA3_ELYCH|nr:hypothetical protein EGW08_008113 [Elysia chlorotica]